MDSLNDVLKGVYTKLTGDATLMGMITGVFDFTPEKQSFPYITFWDILETPLNTFDKVGKNVLIRLKIWTEYEGFKEAATIKSRLDTLLDNGTITLTNHRLISLEFEESNPVIDTFDQTRHLQVTYRCKMQEV